MADSQEPENPQRPPNDPGHQLPLDAGARTLLPVNIEDEMRRSYLDYAMSVQI